MSECRALTNLIGNGVACVVISRSEGELDMDKLHETMAHPDPARRGAGAGMKPSALGNCAGSFAAFCRVMMCPMLARG
jgi:hypothetical protein